jgi:hypothetical protein
LAGGEPSGEGGGHGEKVFSFQEDGEQGLQNL